MRKIYISFLGLGRTTKDHKVLGYDPALYRIGATDSSQKYEFVQSAEMDIVGGAYFDKAFIIVTPQSKEAHFLKLKKELMDLGVKEVECIDIENDLEPDKQWGWFEKVLGVLDRGDELAIDLTHGLRIGSIVISAAINFLQKSKEIVLKHVWYGAFEADKNNPPIVDMKDFYIINEWADAVSRLVEEADARKLGEFAKGGRVPEFQIGNLGDEKMVKAFEDLTEAVRNVEIQKIGEKASKALKLVEENRAEATATGKILLDLVNDKFATLVSAEPVSGKYDLAYFRLQLEIVKILIEHKLFMQAYTVMREFVGSVGLVRNKKAKTHNSEGRSQRYKAEVFVNMVQFDEWKFTDEGQKAAVEQLSPFYEELKGIGVERILKSFCKDLVEYRNGFDHAWTRKTEAFADIGEKARDFHRKLEEVVGILESEGLLS